MRRWALNQVCRWIIRPKLARLKTAQEARADLDRTARMNLRKPPYMLFLDRGDHGQVSVGETDPTRVIFYIHGGGYVAGGPHTHAAMAARISKLTGLTVWMPRYPLAPEARVAERFDAVVAAYDRLLALGYAPSDIALGGDSAGGGLALALLAHLTREGRAPACAFVFSPWTDLTLSGDTLRTNAARDRLLPVSRIDELVDDFVLQGDPPEDPRVSPLFAEFHAPPPVQIHVSKTEILLDDATRMAAHLTAAGGQVDLHIGPDLPHVWPMFDGLIPDARATLRTVVGHVADHLTRPPSQAAPETRSDS